MNLSFLMFIKDLRVWNEGENWILQVNLVNPFLLCKDVYLISWYQFRYSHFACTTHKLCSRRWLYRDKCTSSSAYFPYPSRYPPDLQKNRRFFLEGVVLFALILLLMIQISLEKRQNIVNTLKDVWTNYGSHL